VNGAKLEIQTAATGPNADVLYIGDTTSGTLNLALGDFRISQGAVLTAGTFPSTVGLRCSVNNTLEVNGSIVVTGLGGLSMHNTVSVDSSGGPTTYILAPPITYVGCDTTVPPTGVIKVELPNTLAAGAVDGRQVIIKDEGGGLAFVGQHLELYVGPAGPHGTIDGVVYGIGSEFILNIAYQAVTLVCRGVSGGIANWYFV